MSENSPTSFNTNRADFISPITPRYNEVFYSSIPVSWQDLPNGCTTCLPCSRETFTPPTAIPIYINGEQLQV